MAYVPVVFILAGMAAYTVLAGADFGAGLWTLLAPGPRGEPIRDEARHAMGPVWEANHVWLIFVLVVCWTAYPVAFGSIASTLSAPLLIAAIGIIFRGAAYALRGQGRLPRGGVPVRDFLGAHPVRARHGGGRDRDRSRPGRQRGGQPGHLVAEPRVRADRRARRGVLRIPGGCLPGR